MGTLRCARTEGSRWQVQDSAICRQEFRNFDAPASVPVNQETHYEEAIRRRRTGLGDRCVRWR